MTLKLCMVMAFAAAAAACQMETTPEKISPSGLRNVSPAAIAALPPGIDESFLIRDADGCYGLAVERTEPQTGVALLGANGAQVCDI